MPAHLSGLEKCLAAWMLANQWARVRPNLGKKPHMRAAPTLSEIAIRCAIVVGKKEPSSTASSSDRREGTKIQTGMEVDSSPSDVVSVGADRRPMTLPSISSGYSMRSVSIVLQVQNSHFWRNVWRRKIIQINIQHAKAVSGNLLLRLRRDGTDVVLIQEL